MSQFIEMIGGKPVNGTIADLVEKDIQSVKKTYKPHDTIEYIDISSIDATNRTITTTTLYIVAHAPSRAQQCVEEGDILVSTVRPGNRNIAVVNKKSSNLVSSTGFCVLRPKEGYRYYILSVVLSDSYTEKMCDKANGGLYPAVNSVDVLSYGIHIPDETLLRSISSIYQQADKSEFGGFKSQFIEMFYGEKNTLQQLRPHVTVLRGVSYNPSDIKEETESDATAIFRSNNIDNGRINYEDIVYVDSKRVSKSQVLRQGDIIMCGSNGSKKLVGKAAIVEMIPRKYCSFGAFCLGIRCKETIHPKFLSTFFQTSTYREMIESLGAGSNILNIKPDHIYNLMVPVPPLDEQQKIVSIAQQADKSENDYYKVTRIAA